MSAIPDGTEPDVRGQAWRLVEHLLVQTGTASPLVAHTLGRVISGNLSDDGLLAAEPLSPPEEPAPGWQRRHWLGGP